MKNKKVGIMIIGIIFAFSVALGTLFQSGVGQQILQNGGAMALGSWQDLFRGSSEGNIIEQIDVRDGEDASNTAVNAATSSFTVYDGDDAGARADGTAEKGVGIKNTTGKTAKILKAPEESPSSEENIFIKEPVRVSAPSSDTETSAASVSLLPQMSSSITVVVTSSCAFPLATGTPPQKIILNEIAWMGSLPKNGETALAVSNDEWIELENISAKNIVLAGWAVMDSAGGIKIKFSGTDIIPAHGFFLLTRGSSNLVSGVASKIYSGSLANGGDRLAILDPQCNVSDFLDASAGWPAGDNTTKQTLERNANDHGWHTSASPGGTPGSENSQEVSVASSTFPAVTSTPGVVVTSGGSVTVTPPATSPTTDTSGTALGTTTTAATDAISIVATSTSATSTATMAISSSTICPVNHLVIAQISIDGASSTNDFVRIYNPTADIISLNGWKLRKKSQTGTDSSLKALSSLNSVASGAYFTWANSTGGFSETIHADASSTETIAANNSVALLDASGTVVDAVAWGTGANQYGEGNPFPTNPASGHTLLRKNEDGVITDTDDNASDFALD